MNPQQAHGHHSSETIAHGQVGEVSRCSCGVLTVTLQYISLRLEPAAFRELHALLTVAQRRLDEAQQRISLQAITRPNEAPVH